MDNLFDKDEITCSSSFCVRLLIVLIKLNITNSIKELYLQTIVSNIIIWFFFWILLVWMEGRRERKRMTVYMNIFLYIRKNSHDMCICTKHIEDRANTTSEIKCNIISWTRVVWGMKSHTISILELSCNN